MLLTRSNLLIWFIIFFFGNVEILDEGDSDSEADQDAGSSEEEEEEEREEEDEDDEGKREFHWN